jgi:hypothetical protein
MEITLNSKEINQALIAFASNMVKISPNQKIHIEYKAGRGENGPSASIIIGEEVSESIITKLEEKIEVTEPVTENDIDSDPDNFRPIVFTQPTSNNNYSEDEHEEDDL